MDDWLGYDYQGTKGERCDIAVTLFLRQRDGLAELSRSRVQALIEEGGVLLEGRPVVRVQKNLSPGLHLDINLSKLDKLLNPPAPEDLTPIDLPLTFLHVDEHLAVVIKPAGISVHPAPTEESPTLAAALLHHLGRLATDTETPGPAGLSDAGGADRPGIVHRLDKETSGVLVVARNNPAHVSLSRQFADRTTEKEYVALVLDAPQPEVGAISLPIERHPRHRQKMWAGGRGRDAHTEYRVTARWGPLSLLDVAIHTGRTHQIRVHLLSVGSSILNDDKYGGGRNGSFRKFLRDGRDTGAGRAWKQSLPDPAKRQQLHDLLEVYPGIFLHARKLAFTHPVSGERLSFAAELPTEWQQLGVICEQLTTES